MKKILTEWRNFINESAQEPQKFPEKVYYGIPISQLDKVRDTGMVHMPTAHDVQDKHKNSSTTMQLLQIVAQRFADAFVANCNKIHLIASLQMLRRVLRRFAKLS